jgi:uncharacterized protein (TIGR03435 family)
MSLCNVVWIAFNLRSQQLVAPDWMNEPCFNITAKIPEGTTREQYYLMFQNMLTERFGVKVHHDRKEVPGIRTHGSKERFRSSTSPIPRPRKVPRLPFLSRPPSAPTASPS